MFIKIRTRGGETYEGQSHQFDEKQDCIFYSGGMFSGHKVQINKHSIESIDRDSEATSFVTFIMFMLLFLIVFGVLISL